MQPAVESVEVVEHSTRTCGQLVLRKSVYELTQARQQVAPVRSARLRGAAEHLSGQGDWAEVAAPFDPLSQSSENIK